MDSSCNFQSIRVIIFCNILRSILLRASTLVHVSSPVGRPMQCHIRFLMMWKRESKERERGCCLAKQPPHERSNRLMRQLHNHCMSSCCHATQSTQNQFGGRSLSAVDLTDPAPAPYCLYFFSFHLSTSTGHLLFLLFNFITTHPSFFSHVWAH
jgi:hypothetical protein